MVCGISIRFKQWFEQRGVLPTRLLLNRNPAYRPLNAACKCLNSHTKILYPYLFTLPPTVSVLGNGEIYNLLCDSIETL